MPVTSLLVFHIPFISYSSLHQMHGVIKPIQDLSWDKREERQGDYTDAGYMWKKITSTVLLYQLTIIAASSFTS